MGLLDKLSAGVESHLGGTGAAMPSFLGDALSNLGGYQGIVGLLEQAGLGDRVQSWLSTNAENLPVSPEELQTALGDQRMEQLATKFGVPLDKVTNLLAQQLPTAIDQASPSGTLEQPQQ